jgi:hypothetical protein
MRERIDESCHFRAAPLSTRERIAESVESAGGSGSACPTLAFRAATVRERLLPGSGLKKNAPLRSRLGLRTNAPSRSRLGIKSHTSRAEPAS